MIIDTNAHLGRWPFRSFPWDDTPALLRKLESTGITQAWVASFDGPFHRDLAAVNARLAVECRDHQKILVPFGTVNPLTPAWQSDLRRCHEEHKFKGIRLYPGYHSYALDDPQFASLLKLSAERGLLVQIVVQLEDPRTQHPRMQVPAVDVAPLSALVLKTPSLRLQILNMSGVISDEVLIPLSRAGNVLFDMATVEGLGGVRKFVDRVGLERVALGTHFPLFYPESSLLKIKEGQFGDLETAALQHENARRLLPGNE